MQATKRQREPGVVGHLTEEPYRFQFFQAVRVLVQWLAKNGVPHDKAFSDVLRFRNSLSLSFPASELESLVTQVGASPGQIASLPVALKHGKARIHLTPAFIGLLGANGALPFHYSELIGELERHEKNTGARAFLDIFSNRMVGLFYQAWGKYRVEHTFDTQGKDSLLPRLMALAGIRTDAFSSGPGRREIGGMTEDVAGYYAALLRTRPVSASTIGRVLEDYFRLPIEAEQFVGSWDYIPESKRSKLGTANPKLGYGAALGVRLWRQDLRVRLRIGPLDKASLTRFLPRGDAAAALAKMLALMGAPDLQYEVCLILSKPCIEPLVLSTARPDKMRRLGWDSFLVSGSGNVSRANVCYILHLDHGQAGNTKFDLDQLARG